MTESTLSLDGLPDAEAVRRLRDGLLAAFNSGEEVTLGTVRYKCVGIDREITMFKVPPKVEIVAGHRQVPGDDGWAHWELTGADHIRLEYEGERISFSLARSDGVAAL